MPSASTNAFPVQLHSLLTEAETDGLVSSISFLPHGRAFIVRDISRFVETILPNWFRQSKYASFQRQLNLYEFKRIGSGPDKGAYHHPQFLRGFPALAGQMRRNAVKGAGAQLQPAQDPNFYAMSPLLGPPKVNVASLPISHSLLLGSVATASNNSAAVSSAMPLSFSSVHSILSRAPSGLSINTNSLTNQWDNDHRCLGNLSSTFGALHPNPNDMIGATATPWRNLNSSSGPFDPHSIHTNGTTHSSLIVERARNALRHDISDDLRQSLTRELQLHQQLARPAAPMASRIEPSVACVVQEFGPMRADRDANPFFAAEHLPVAAPATHFGERTQPDADQAATAQTFEQALVQRVLADYQKAQENR